MRVALPAAVTHFGSNAYESLGTSALFRNDVSRVDESRFELRRHLFCRRPHHGNFLPADVHGKKAGARERRFFRNTKRSIAQRVPSVFALPPNGSGHASSKTD